MNRMKKKLLLIGMASLTLAACQASAESEADTGNTSTNDGATSTENVASTVNPEGFPIVDETIELEFFTGKYEPNLNDYEETLVFSTFEEKSNIDVEFTEIPFGSLTEQRNLALASGDYPDVFYSARIPAADLYSYGQQGVFVPLNDLIEEYAPNITAFFERNPDAKAGLTMPDGNIYSIPSYYDPEFLPMLIGKPLWVKESWLDELDMDEPTTIEEFYDYLVAVRDTDLNGNGENDEIPLTASNMNQIVNSLKGSWGVGTTGVGQSWTDLNPETGEMRFQRTSDEYKQVLEFVHALYSEGLIDPEIFTMDDTKQNAKGSQGILGTAIVPNPLTVFADQNDYIGLGALEGPNGDKLYSHVKKPLVHVGAFAMTDKNEHPEATIRWIDYFFGEEGATLQFMGIEGESYVVNDAGDYEFLKEITNNSDGLTFDQALTPYVTWMGGSYPGYVQEKYFKGSEAMPNSLAVGEKVAPDAPEELWNGFNYTDEELDFKQTIGSDLQQYVSEQEALFMSGDKSFDDWDAHVEQIEAMGLEEYMAVEKAAYDRYKAAIE